MARLVRTEQQLRTHARVLAAARTEFLRHGFSDTTVDAVAARAELTRSTVYSVFPTKTALYLAALTDHTTIAARALDTYAGPPSRPARTATDAVHAFATQWLRQLQPTEPGTTATGGMRVSALFADLVPLAVTRLRAPLSGLSALTAALVALALRDLERRHPARDHAGPAHDYRPVSEATLATLLATTIAPWTAPQADLAHIPDQCARYAAQHTGTYPATSDAQHVNHVVHEGGSAVRLRPLPWSPLRGHDLLHDTPADLYRDQYVLFTGLHAAPAIVEQLAVLPARTPLTVVVVTGPDRDVEPLTQLLLGLTCRALRRIFPADFLPVLQVVLDTSGTLALAARILDATPDTLTAVTVSAQQLTWRADDATALAALLTGRR
ncbi:TetR/AcrR family transcriptional regulator [Nocardia blacklockiae]|uniref:TetR/AcrR family transcriptional regulator n=1 Tax=Nocardia blacklockiae TaxID=480036 RepID=UPI0018938744|nr:TetR/AcrR family transcriptional regulator [Nocardia blacklockiae]MBF6176027.1 TetR/AcrR family transcriptional regulator [Nocardia blacklockiae]